MPKYWANYAGNFAEQSDEVHEQFGFFPVIFPEYDALTQIRASEPHWDDASHVFTYLVTDKSLEQIEAEQQAYLDSLDAIWDEQAAKRLLQKVATPILADEDNLTEQDIIDVAMLYPYYRAGKAYAVGERFRYELHLFEVIQAHTSQEDWIPTEVPALYKKFTTPGTMAEWVQPTGAQDAYKTGDKVLFEGSTYESLINANVWSPAAYPAGWKIL